jgi:translation initiation factor 2 gamma subunit (eIF-2gamma)
VVRRSGDEGSTGDSAPDLEGAVAGGSMLVGGQAVATELEMIVDLAVAGEKLLGVPRRLEALHLPFASSRRLVRDLHPVV